MRAAYSQAKREGGHGNERRHLARELSARAQDWFGELWLLTQLSTMLF
jgi:hypothetical protein